MDMNKKIKIFNIKWDVADGTEELSNQEKNEILSSLPTEINIMIDDLSNYDVNTKSSEDEIADAVSEWLSDKYGFCHQGYNLEEDILWFINLYH